MGYGAARRRVRHDRNDFYSRGVGAHCRVAVVASETGAELQRVLAFAAGQFERVLRQCGLELFHVTGIGEVDLCLVRVRRRRRPSRLPPWRRPTARGASPNPQCIEPDVYGEVRGGVLDRRDRAIDGLFPLTRCVHRCPGEDNVRLAQQLAHRSRIEMKRDVGEVARRVAPFVAGVTAEDQAREARARRASALFPRRAHR